VIAMFLLDTNACIRYLNARSEVLRRRIDEAGDDQIAVCSVVKAELAFGAAKCKAPDRVLALQQMFTARFVSMPFDDSAAVAYATIRADLESRGLPIGANDLMIAAIALANRLTLVTQNTDEFSRVNGLGVVDWEK